MHKQKILFFNSIVFTFKKILIFLKLIFTRIIQIEKQIYYCCYFSVEFN
jgi:hypothetical protein